MENDTNNSTIITENDFMIQLISESEAQDQFQEANSATVNNPAVTWAKFVLTDDQPNDNDMRVPIEEFPNLIRSGVYMPIKMARGGIKDGHEVAEPLGVITNLKRIVSKENVNQVVGLAALWLREREGDIKLIKDKSKTGSPVTLSWEILYNDFDLIDGIKNLKGTYLKASTIVGRPAYGNRTPILAIAEKGSSAYLDELPDESFLLVGHGESKERRFPYMDSKGTVDKELLSNMMEEIENDATLGQETKSTLLEKANELMNTQPESSLEPNMEENTLDELEIIKTEVEQLKQDLSSSKLLLQEKEQSLVEKEVELVALREFKASVDAKASEVEKLAAIKTKFASAGIVKEDAYFDEHKTFLVNMTDEALEFMLQELVAFSSTSDKNASASVNIPNLASKRDVVTNNVKAIAEALRVRKQ